jgi:hypothetical protein
MKVFQIDLNAGNEKEKIEKVKIENFQSEIGITGEPADNSFNTFF